VVIAPSQITIVHGGQTGVDRGAHEAAIDNGWRATGYMPRDKRDELGEIPGDVARFLTPHEKASYAARTEANVLAADAALIVVPDKDDPRATPGTAKTLDLVAQRRLRRMVVEPTTDAEAIARWIRNDLLMLGALLLPLDGLKLDPAPARLLVAGPRESRWPGARVETAALLRRVALAIGEIGRTPSTKRDPLRERR
jgi:hypothetical protein